MSNLSNAQWSKKRLLIGMVLICIVAAILCSGFHKHLSFNNIKSHSVWLRDYVENHYMRSVLLYMSTYFILIMCCMPGIAFLSLIGGFLFGVIPATIFTNIAATTAATLFFFMMRYMIGVYVQLKFAHRLVGFNAMIEKRGWLFLLALRLFPMIPFFTINLLASLTKIRPTVFMWTTAVGIIPSTLIFTFAGRQLGTLVEFRQIFSFPILAALGALIALIGMSYLINRYYKIF